MNFKIRSALTFDKLLEAFPEHAGWINRLDREVRNESHDVDPEKSPVKDQVKSPKAPSLEERFEHILAKLDRLEMVCQRLEGLVAAMSAKK